jgi:uncharacterized protein
MNAPATSATRRWPPQIKFIVGNEACERFSYYGMRSILAGYVTSTVLKGGLGQSVNEHFEYLQKLVVEGVVFMAGRTQNIGERTFGIVVFEAATEAVAMALMQNDPAVKPGVMKAALFPYRIALWSAKGPKD